MKKSILQFLLFLFIANLASAQQWQAVTTPFNAFPVIDQSLFAKNDLVMTISKTDAYVSTDAGKTWLIATLPNALTKPSAVTATQKKLIVATLNEIYASTDNGKTWKIDYATDGVDQFTTIDNVVYGSTNKGVVQYNETKSAWEIIGLSGKNLNYLYSDTKVLYAGEFLNNNYTLHRSADKGKTWTVVTGLFIPKAVAKAGTIAYAGAIGSGLYTSPDNGITWDGSVFGTPSDNVYDLVSIDDSLFVSYKGSSFDPALGLYRYDAVKDTWIAKNGNLPNKNLVKIAYNGNGTLWAIQQNETNTNGILYKVGIGKKTSGTTDKNLLAAESKMTIFPNPSMGIINLQMNKGENLPNQIDIFDLQGKLVESIKNNTNNSILLQKTIQGAYVIKSYFGEKYTIHNIVIE